MSLILGIDPGIYGGIALIESAGRPHVVLAADIPTVGVDAKRRVDVAKVLGILQAHKITHGFIERAQAMPKQGSSSGFLYGRAVGALEACAVGMQIPLQIIEASAWKKTHGLIRPKDFPPEEWAKVVKRRSIECAKLLFPEAQDRLARVSVDHGRAEAILIAAHGLALLRQPPAPPRGTKRRAGQLALL